MHSGPFHDPTDDRYRSTLRYLAAAANSGWGEHYGGQRSVDLRSEHETTGPAFVCDVMVSGVVAAHEGAVFKEIVDALIRNHVSAVPVINQRRQVIGVVSESDLLARVSGGHVTHPRGHRLSARREERAKLHATSAHDLMTSPAVTTTPDTTIEEAARTCADHRVRRLPVVDGSGLLVGIVTRADLLQPFLRPDDEIRQDIEQRVIVATFVMNPAQLAVTVRDGIVVLRGQLERRLVLDAFIGAVRNVPGVIDVDDSMLTYEYDDLSTRGTFAGN